MTKIKNNPLLTGASGMLGGVVVLKQLRGKTVMANRPRPAHRQSKLQRANRRHFRDATRFAKAAMLDSLKKAYYWEKAHELNLPNAYTAAITEYMRKGKPAQPTVRKAQQSSIESARVVHTTTPRPICYPVFPGYTLGHQSWTVSWSSTQHCRVPLTVDHGLFPNN